jgi:hypothetical protein
MLPVRKGVGWLVATAAAAGGDPPLVLPFVHGGMERILPKGSSLPKLGVCVWASGVVVWGREWGGESEMQACLLIGGPGHPCAFLCLCVAAVGSCCG